MSLVAGEESNQEARTFHLLPSNSPGLSQLLHPPISSEQQRSCSHCLTQRHQPASCPFWSCFFTLLSHKQISLGKNSMKEIQEKHFLLLSAHQLVRVNPRPTDLCFELIQALQHPCCPLFHLPSCPFISCSCPVSPVASDRSLSHTTPYVSHNPKFTLFPLYHTQLKHWKAFTISNRKGIFNGNIIHSCSIFNVDN